MKAEIITFILCVVALTTQVSCSTGLKKDLKCMEQQRAAYMDASALMYKSQLAEMFRDRKILVVKLHSHQDATLKADGWSIVVNYIDIPGLEKGSSRWIKMEPIFLARKRVLARFSLLMIMYRPKVGIGMLEAMCDTEADLEPFVPLAEYRKGDSMDPHFLSAAGQAYSDLQSIGGYTEADFRTVFGDGFKPDPSWK